MKEQIISYLKAKGAKLLIQFYPNPVSSGLYLDLPTYFAKGVAEIFNLNGKRVQKARLISKNPELNVMALKPGVYLLCITNADFR